MVLTSGNPPYDYATDDPLRVVNPYASDYVVGGSGLNLEQGQFVITAEIRKFDTSSHELPPFNVYVNPVITPSGPYEPKANGSTLANLLNPANQSIINHILETRDALDAMFATYQNITEHTFAEMKIDWLKQISPELPLPSGYRRQDPGETDEPFIVTVDVNMLGGSGVLFDLDFAEVMFNPYPFFSNNVFLDVHGLGTFRIVNAPVWPCFQKTDGSFVGLNGREPTTANGISSEYDLSHFAASELRLDGYVFLPQTEYFIGRGLHDFVPDGSLTYVSSSPRTFPNGQIVPTTRVFATTVPLSSGIYKTVARNRKAVIPTTTVASGLISQWPPSGQAWPATNGHVFDVVPGFNIRSVWYNNQEYEHGYQVFDDAFWIIDHADGDRAPSGLAIASPFTGHCMWLRYAELTQSSGSGVFGGLANSAGSWGQHVGLEKFGSTIFRLQRTVANGSDSAHHQALIQQYDEDLNYLGQINGPDANPGPGAPSTYTDMTFLSTSSVTLNEWMLYGHDTGGRLSITFYDQAFGTHLRSNGGFYIGSLTVGAGDAIDQGSIIKGASEFNGIARSPAEFSDGNNVGGFHTRGSGIWDLEIGTPGSGVIFKNCRVIDMSKVTRQWSTTLEAKIHDLMEVPITATHVQPGFYALVSWGDASAHRLFLLRIVPRDDVTAPGFCVGFWDILAAYDLGTLPSDVVIAINNTPNMIYQAID